MSSEQGRFSDEALRAIAPTQRRAIPDPEGLIDELEQALGYLSDLAPGIRLSGKPMKMAREMHAAVTEHFESLQKRLSAAEMDRATLFDILVSGAKPPSFRVRVREAWRVIRGVVNVGDLRQYVLEKRNDGPGESRMKPTVCRSVHYVAFGTPGGEYQEGAHRAAIITDVHVGTGKNGQPPDVSLVIFNPTGLHFRANVPYDAAGTLPGTWHEPERE